VGVGLDQAGHERRPGEVHVPGVRVGGEQVGGAAHRGDARALDVEAACVQDVELGALAPAGQDPKIRAGFTGAYGTGGTLSISGDSAYSTLFALANPRSMA